MAQTSVGDIIITEILADPLGTDTNLEFLELFNTTDTEIDLTGWVINQDTDSGHTIGDLNVPARSFVVLCRNMSSLAACDYVYTGGITLNNTSDAIVVTSPDNVVTHSVTYSNGSAFGAGVSMELANEAGALSGTSTGPTGGTDYVASTSPLATSGTSFASPGSAGNTVLPVSLTHLTAHPMPKTTMVKWTTAQESGNDFFAVERSLDGRAFTEIGRVRGAGNSAAATSYEFTDEAPVAGTTYYRLRQVDFSGAQAVFGPVPVVRTGEGISAFPNPASDFIAVRGAAAGAQLTILDLNGRVISQSANTGNDVDVRNLRPGTYLVRISDANTVETLRFVRQ